MTRTRTARPTATPAPGRRAAPEGPLQRAAAAGAASGRLATLQRLAERSPAPVQRAGLEEEEPLQGKAIQRASLEEEEPLQGKAIQRAGLEEEEPLQGKAIQRAALASPAPTRGPGLPPGLRSGIEALSGMAMDDVRVHYDSPRPAQFAAHAYAQGGDIHLAPGQERHLPHEAWHVVQQGQGRVQPTAAVGGAPVNDDPALEAEADAMGARAAASGARDPAGGGSRGA